MAPKRAIFFTTSAFTYCALIAAVLMACVFVIASCIVLLFVCLMMQRCGGFYECRNIRVGLTGGLGLVNKGLGNSKSKGKS